MINALVLVLRFYITCVAQLLAGVRCAENVIVQLHLWEQEQRYEGERRVGARRPVTGIYYVIYVILLV